MKQLTLVEIIEQTCTRVDYSMLPEYMKGGAQQYVESEDPAFPRIRYEDSLVSMNDRCIVRLRKLSPKIQPVYVNGRPIGFC